MADLRLHGGFVYLFVPLSNDGWLTGRIRMETDTSTPRRLRGDLYRDAFAKDYANVVAQQSRMRMRDPGVGVTGS